MKIIEERETQIQQKKKTKTENRGGTEAIVKEWELNDFDVRLS